MPSTKDLDKLVNSNECGRPWIIQHKLPEFVFVAIGLLIAIACPWPVIRAWTSECSGLYACMHECKAYNPHMPEAHARTHTRIHMHAHTHAHMCIHTPTHAQEHEPNNSSNKFKTLLLSQMFAMKMKGADLCREFSLISGTHSLNPRKQVW